MTNSLFLKLAGMMLGALAIVVSFFFGTLYALNDDSI
jgi:hypothetical protein